MFNYREFLNEEQFSAVSSPIGPVLVSAGAGSGKTRLLTYRIHYLVVEKGINPLNILAITFTNKASKEMRERIEKIVPDGYMCTICTIHSFCVKVLRQYATFLDGYDTNFSIYSDSDINKIYKKIFDNLRVDNEMKDKIRWHISNIKNNNYDLYDYLKMVDYVNYTDLIEKAYNQYQFELKKNNAMDFDDLLLNTLILLKSQPDILHSLQKKYKHIHIDEFQDTNIVQYDMIKLLAGDHASLFVVGDENQSIYGWRGANIENMADFLRDFPKVQVKKLECNYRSTKNILNTANKLIKNNDILIEKTLYTQNEDGAPVKYFCAYDENEEADFVARCISRFIAEGVKPSEIAILMRVNALSRPFEEKLLTYNIAHKIYNGFKFYERQEIKNTLAYVIAMLNPADNQNLVKIINFPKRGIGDTSIKRLMEISDATHTPIYEVILNADNLDLPKALKQKLSALKDLLLSIYAVKDADIYTVAKEIVNKAGILANFKLSDEDDLERYHNINSLLQSMQEFVKNNTDASIKAYIDSVSLISQLDEMESEKSFVNIASVHGAKGLEFDVVFVVGAEEGIFPVSRKDDTNLQEERRLMYVAMTRARKYLVVTSCKTRFLYGKREACLRSRFVDEAELYVSTANYRPYQSRSTQQYARPTFASKPVSDITNAKKLSIDDAVIGNIVQHVRFGKGKIINADNLYVDKCIDIDFDGFGVKHLSIEYAPLELVKGE